MTLGQRIKAARKRLGERLGRRVTQSELAELCGWDQAQSRISGYENDTREPSLADLEKIAEVTGVGLSWLLTGKEPEEKLEPGPNVGRQRKIPIVGTAQLGDNGFWYETEYPVGSGDGYIYAPTADLNAYALRVRGHSMHPAIRDGWFVVVEPNREPIPGEYVMVRLNDGRSMVKEFLWMRDGQLSVQSINEDRRYTFDLQEVDKIHYVGPIVPPSKRRFE